MTFGSRLHRSDTTQAQIVKDLRACGYLVELIGEPVDILVRHPTWYRNAWVLADCKTRNRKSGYKPRSDQKQQHEFCEANEVPYFCDTQEALDYLRMRGERLIDVYHDRRISASGGRVGA